ncbi:MAG TPA: VOC family protein [Micropepsaceae bacterium]|nr:VOC family protein [Micropepsaceae bacterium]HRK71415.1 VOC family protein [Micropepsaceae bacterium]
MIGYATVGTNDLARATAFFDAVFGEMGAKRAWSNERMAGWTTGKAAPMLMVTKPYDGKPATGGNGTMIALAAADQETVNKVHAKALSLGGKDEGAPGLRGDNFYGAYFRDLDGNKYVAFVMVKK